MSVSLLLRATCAAAIIAGVGTERQVAAQTTASYGTIDPFDYAPPVGAVPDNITLQNTWQTDPFNVGYNLLGGYRGLYSGAAQPIGHEMFSTYGGNGYVYRPVYGSQPFYNRQHFGSYAVVPNHGYQGRALVIDNPGTPYESRYTPNQQIGRGHAAMIDVMPHYAYADGAMAPGGYGYDNGYGYDYVDQATYEAPLTAETTDGVETMPEPTPAPVKKPAKVKPAQPKAAAAKSQPGPAPKKREF